MESSHNRMSLMLVYVECNIRLRYVPSLTPIAPEVLQVVPNQGHGEVSGVKSQSNVMSVYMC